jgi:glycosyltransferase involved in cell wall biosynthesis
MGVSGEFIWLMAGRIVAAKDYPNLLNAFALVRASVPSTCLWIAGEAVGAGSAAGQVLAVDSGDSVRWLGLRRDMPALLDAADGFVLASAWEGMPLAVGEAMAMEKPVVATDVGGVRELMGESGVIVPAKNPEGLAEAMLKMMRKTDEERRRLGQAARKRIVAHFSMDAKADEWEALYRKTLINRS